jgi:hypothetical protein
MEPSQEPSYLNRVASMRQFPICVRTTLSVVAAAVFAQTALAEEIFAVGWPSQAYSIESTTGAARGVGTVSTIAVNALARSPGGVLYTINSTNLLTVDPVTGAATKAASIILSGPGGNYISVHAMAFSPAGVLYFINRDEIAPFPSDRLCSLDVNTGQGLIIGLTALNPHMQGLACAPNGTLYGWHTEVGLVTINPGTGIATDVNPALGASANLQCLGFSPGGMLYGAQTALYIVNPSDGALSLIGGNLADIRGLEFIPKQTPKLTISKTPNGVQLCTLTQNNRTYQLQYRSGLESTNTWANLGAAMPGTGGEICVTNIVNAGRQFYRLAVTP